jgi:D-alanyl-D-alanine dipeptidase
MLETPKVFANIPEEFVYLKDIDPSIQVHLRYATADNFLGRVVKGYHNNHSAILTKEAASALKKAQSIFKEDGFSIVVYDAYRPQTAVEDFYNWSLDLKDDIAKDQYYPRLTKDKIFSSGYISRRSSHSRGGAVDITIIEGNKLVSPIKLEKRLFADGSEFIYLNDQTLDMGSSFDLFDEASHYPNNIISPEQKLRRSYLKRVMESCGFIPYNEEWWHFTIANEPFPETYFDFPVG